jgi:hypothetical protein
MVLFITGVTFGPGCPLQSFCKGTQKGFTLASLTHVYNKKEIVFFNLTVYDYLLGSTQTIRINDANKINTFCKIL